MNDLATLTEMPFENMMRLAESIAKSNLFGIKTPEQAIVLMSIAQAEGRHPALAARDYDIIAGRPSKKAEAMQRDFLLAGGKIEWHSLSDAGAEATFSHPQGGTVTLKWDMDRAKKAEISNNPMYRKYPRAMFRARTVAEGVRAVFPAATGGMFVPEEAGDEPLVNVTPKQVETQIASWRDEKEGRPTETTWEDVGLDLNALLKQGNVACRDIDMLQDWWMRHLTSEQRGVLGAKGRGVGPYLPGWKQGEIQSAPTPQAQSPEAVAEVPHTPTAQPPGESSGPFGLPDNRTPPQIFADNVFERVFECRTEGEIEEVERQAKQEMDKLSDHDWRALQSRIDRRKDDIRVPANA